MPKHRPSSWVVVVLAGSVVVGAAAGMSAVVAARQSAQGAGEAAGGPADADCLACHADKDLAKTGADGKPISLFVDEQQFAGSIHGANKCTSCHSDVTAIPHPDNFTAQPVSCSQCHRIETEIYRQSDHGIAVHGGTSEAASCKDCHGGNHYLLNSRNPQSPVYRVNLSKTCGRCHSATEEMRKFGLRQAAPVLTYEQSVHGIALLQRGQLNAAVCTDCHGSHDLHQFTNAASKLFWQTVPTTCGRCHENVERTYRQSIHGQAVAEGVRDAAMCTDCHGEHTIAAVKAAGSRVAPSQVPDTCGQCHSAQRLVTQYQLPPNVASTYAESFHGLALQGGNPTVANCASCHGFHDILPSSDVRSSVHQQNLPQTCGRCHPGIGTRLSAEFFQVHAPAGAEGQPWLVKLVTWLYIGLIAVTIGGMAIFVALDYLRKARAHMSHVASSKTSELRLTPSLRWQHLLLTGLFTLLAYTGFVQHYPNTFFSWPFQVMENGSAVRGLVHRVCGWTFAAFFLAHVVALLGTRQGRRYGGELWFRWVDVKDGLAQLAYNLGRRPTAPPRRRWNYAEKAEYWALVWGSVVMVITGIMLVFGEAMLRLLPKVWHDLAHVIHYYEAVLATLAILVWHFYWVIFDPAEYPMNPAWLNGLRPGHGAPPTDEPPAPTDEPPVDQPPPAANAQPGPTGPAAQGGATPPAETA